MQRIKHLTVQLWEYVLEDLDNEKSGNSLARLQGEWVELQKCQCQRRRKKRYIRPADESLGTYWIHLSE